MVNPKRKDLLFSLEKPQTIRHNIRQCQEAHSKDRELVTAELDKYAKAFIEGNGVVSEAKIDGITYRLRKLFGSISTRSASIRRLVKDLQLSEEGEKT